MNVCHLLIVINKIKGKTMKLIKQAKFSLLAFVAIATISTQTLADDKAQQAFDFNDVTCWDIMILNDNERPYALTMLYGYRAGKNGKTTHTGVDIEKTLSKTGELCKDKPDMKALMALDEVLK